MVTSTRRWISGLLVTAGCATALNAQSTTRVSVSSSGVQLDAASLLGSCSADGRLIAFQSEAPNLASGDANGAFDVFVHDRATGQTTLISAALGGSPANAQSLGPRISGDGRYVAFASDATDLVVGDTNGVCDVFVRDRLANTTVRISVDSSGNQADDDSGSAVYQSYAEIHHSPFALDISDDGRFVAFESLATNLVPGDTNSKQDIFVHDALTGATERVSLASTGAQSAKASNYARISGDGQRVLFWTADRLAPTDLEDVIDVYVRDRAAGTTTQVSLPYGANQNNASSFALDISSDGRFALFASGSHALLPAQWSTHTEVYVRDLLLGVNSVVSVATGGAPGNNYAGLELIGAISADGRYAVFDSWASNLAPNDTNNVPDLYLRDRVAGTTERVNVSSTGVQSVGLAKSRCWDISADGRCAVFQSEPGVTQMVAGDTNDAHDVFVRDRASTCPPVTRFCTAKVNSAGCTPAISTSGEPYTTGLDAFYVSATNVLSGQRGNFFWSATSGAVPFGGGLRCVLEPLVRTVSVSSGGNPNALDCSGTYSFHFGHAYLARNAVPVGTTLFAQFWSTDPGFAGSQAIGLTDAVRFTVGP